MTEPERDQSGKVMPHDHPEIGAEYGVIRRIHAQHVIDAQDGTRRISSMAYQASSEPGGGMSVDIEELIHIHGLQPREHLLKGDFLGAVKLLAGAYRELGFLVGYDPLPDNLCHGEVWGNFSKAKKREIQRRVSWFVEIGGVDLA